MSKKGLPKYRLEQFEAMVTDELKPLQTLTEAVEERLRMKVERQLASKTGLNKILKKRDKLSIEIEDLDAQVKRVCGTPQGWNNTRFYNDDSPFGKEVAAAMSQANGVVGAFRDLQRRALRAVRLVDAPDQIAGLLEDLGNEVAKLMKSAVEEHKKLPAPSPDA